MKAQLAVALSLVGVLGAGSAAALVNTQILDSDPPSSGASSAVRPPAASVDVTIPSTTTSASSVPSSSVTVPSTSLPTSTAAPAGSEQLTAFNVGQAGVVTVDVVKGGLVLVSAEPKDGWTVTSAEEHPDDNDVEVEFRSATRRVEFEAHLVDGEIVPKVEASSIAPPANGTATTNSAATRTRNTTANTTANSTANSAPTVTIDDDHDDDHDDEDHSGSGRGGDDDHDDDHDDEDHSGSGRGGDDDHDDERDDD